PSQVRWRAWSPIRAAARPRRWRCATAGADRNGSRSSRRSRCRRKPSLHSPGPSAPAPRSPLDSATGSSAGSVARGRTSTCPPCRACARCRRCWSCMIATTGRCPGATATRWPTPGPARGCGPCTASATAGSCATTRCWRRSRTFFRLHGRRACCPRTRAANWTRPSIRSGSRARGADRPAALFPPRARLYPVAPGTVAPAQGMAGTADRPAPADLSLNAPAQPAANWRSQPHSIVERDGVRYTLLGTAHVSHASVEAVREAIASGGFDTVAVELDEQRLKAMGDPDAVAKLDLVKVLREGKTPLFAANLALASYQRRLAEQLGIEPGAELKTAVEDAQARGLPVHLVDRDVGLTFRRALQGLGWWQRAKLGGGILAGLVVDEEV